MILLRTLFLLKLLCLLIVFSGWAQEKIQVVTKTIQQEIPWKETQQLIINAEKAVISVQGWNRNEVKLTLKLVAKHPSRAVAEQDLSTLRYAINAENKQIELTNFFRIPEGKPKIRSNLQAVYELTIPQASQLAIHNRYGNISLTDWQGNVQVTTGFGEVQASNIKGKVQLDVDYGDILADQVSGDLVINAKKTNIFGHGLAGTLLINCAYGGIDISTQDRLSQVAIDASKAEVSFATSEPMFYNYNLEAFAGRVQTSLPGKRTDNNNLFLGKQTFQSYESQQGQPTVFIKTSYSTINIEKLEKDAKKTARSTYRP